MDVSPLIITLQAAVVSTTATFFVGLVLAHHVAFAKRWQALWDTVLTLPLILPPTVTGFFLLRLFAQQGVLGQGLARLGLSVVFSFWGIVVASAVVSLPLMYRTVRGGFEQLDVTVLQAAATLGLSPRRIFWTIQVPMAKNSIVGGSILAFARAMGEFGATMMLAGNVPGRTQTMSVAVFTAVNAGNFQLAYLWSSILSLLSLVAMSVMNHLTKERC